MMSNCTVLHGFTGGEFEEALARFDKIIQNSPDAPHFRDDEHKSDAGVLGQVRIVCIRKRGSFIGKNKHSLTKYQVTYLVIQSANYMLITHKISY